MSIDLVLDSTNAQSTDNQLTEQADNILSEIEKLTPEEQATVKSFSEKIDLTNNDIVMNYGNTVQKQSSTVTSKTLQSVRTKDTGSAGQLMVQMACAMNGLEGNDGDNSFIQKICNKVRLSAKDRGNIPVQQTPSLHETTSNLSARGSINFPKSET